MPRWNAVLAAATAVAIGCASTSQRSATELAQLERHIQFTVTPVVAHLRPDENLRLTFAVRNRSDQRVVVCLAAGLVVNFWGLDQRYARGTVLGLVDHANCERKIALPAFGETTWSEMIPNLSLPTGRARIIASAQIVSLANCDRYGCDYRWLTALYEPIEIAE